MSTSTLVPSGLQTSSPNLIRSINKSVSKPFIGKKVAFLKASVSALAEELKHKQDELDKVLNQLEDMDKRKDALNKEIEVISAEHSVMAMGWEEKIETERSVGEKENEEDELKYESTKKELEEAVENLKVKKEERYQNVWGELNMKLEELQKEAATETKKVAVEKSNLIAEKDGIIAKLEKDKRSVRKMSSLMKGAMTRQLS
mmetsp:Transcript_41248/g.50179  ORF Transcript_41248/g.50179 Transcript_41248/m.50179 type:complete len:202 (+) Transcript_41248:76-681(+)|eukprot:CAMPEP_0172491174 /NCGR_PEP_ID=MMETSP1066-20121228/21890_1 /TAXON_ID=671091 /ORGANISM="Coscinodiscus wailesii, Strain CCMP2513" /LENGTH=201 /DNA_ID=CAMNT_0013260073 /DNA_START=47 /DNA_END=652 /DNA_ORIENTATION=-